MSKIFPEGTDYSAIQFPQGEKHEGNFSGRCSRGRIGKTYPPLRCGQGKRGRGPGPFPFYFVIGRGESERKPLFLNRGSMGTAVVRRPKSWRARLFPFFFRLKRWERRPFPDPCYRRFTSWAVHQTNSRIRTIPGGVRSAARMGRDPKRRPPKTPPGRRATGTGSAERSLNPSAAINLLKQNFQSRRRRRFHHWIK